MCHFFHIKIARLCSIHESVDNGVENRFTMSELFALLILNSFGLFSIISPSEISFSINDKDIDIITV